MAGPASALGLAVEPVRPAAAGCSAELASVGFELADEWAEVASSKQADAQHVEANFIQHASWLLVVNFERVAWCLAEENSALAAGPREGASFELAILQPLAGSSKQA